MKDYVNKNYLFLFFLFLCYFSFFLRLTSYPLLMWDESRFAVNAFEMLKTKNLIVTYFNGGPDLWNTKPPLNVWILALFMKLFGYSDLVLRLPSALASLSTAIIIYRFVEKHLQSAVAAFFCGMILITSIGFVGVHVSRSADADSLVVLFITLFAVNFYNSLVLSQDKLIDKKKFYLSAVFFSLALLTKSAYPLFILPGLLVFIFAINKQRILGTFYFYFTLLLSVLPFVAYCLIRENQNQQYLYAVWENDFGGRFLNTLEQHSFPFYYYFLQLLNERFFYWFYLVLIGFPFLLNKNKNEKKLSLMCLLAGFSFLIIISFSKTKLSHYDAAVYPFFSITGGIVLNKFCNYIIGRFNITSRNFTRVFYFLFFILLFFYPSKKLLSYINIKPGEAAALNLKYGPFMKKLYKEGVREPISFYDKDYNAHLIYYTDVYSAYGNDFRLITNLNELKMGDLVATCMPELKSEIQSKHTVTKFREDEYCTCYEIIK